MARTRPIRKFRRALLLPITCYGRVLFFQWFADLWREHRRFAKGSSFFGHCIPPLAREKADSKRVLQVKYNAKLIRHLTRSPFHSPIIWWVKTASAASTVPDSGQLLHCVLFLQQVVPYKNPKKASLKISISACRGFCVLTINDRFRVESLFVAETPPCV
eukprot:scaffold1569_cov266-Pinguiococcus_pyrenoidosus.AAC.5